MYNYPLTQICFIVLSAFTAIIPCPDHALADTKETTIYKIDGRNLHYRDEGTGKPVLILHGTDLWVPESWDRTIEALVQAGYRVIFPHRAGRGQSDPHPVFLSLAREARDMWAVVDHLKLGKVTLVGHSQGATIAREMLLKRPQHVLGVVSEDGSSFGKLGQAIAKASIDRFDAEDRASYEKYKATLKYIERTWDYPGHRNVMYLLKRRSMQRQADEWKMIQVPDPDDAIIPKTKWCKAPLLVFTAGRGRIRQNDAEVRALKKRLPSDEAKLVVVTKSGHEIHDQQTAIFNRELISFLNQLPK